MAGSEGTTFENPSYEPDDWDDNDDAEEGNKTQPFKPKDSSSPYPGGEKVEKVAFQTMLNEQSGLPDTSFDENIPLIG